MELQHHILDAYGIILYSCVDGLHADRAGRAVPHADCLRHSDGGSLAHVCFGRDPQYAAGEGPQGL